MAVTLRAELIRLGDGERLDGSASGTLEGPPLAANELSVGATPAALIPARPDSERGDYCRVTVIGAGAAVVGTQAAMTVATGAYVEAGQPVTMRLHPSALVYVIEHPGTPSVGVFADAFGPEFA